MIRKAQSRPTVRSIAFQRAAALAETPRTTPLELAKALWTLKANEPDGFQEIIISRKVGRRHAYYLVEVWGRFAKLRLSPERLAAIGWTKLAILAKHCSPGSERIAMAMALRHTAKDLPAALEGRKIASKPKRTVLLRLTQRQYKFLSDALLANGAQPSSNGRGFVDQEAAIVRIANIALRSHGKSSSRGRNT